MSTSMDNATIDTMISKERLEEIIKIEEQRVLQEFRTKHCKTVNVDAYTSWGVIHHVTGIEEDEDVYLVLKDITENEEGFVCFKSTPDASEIIQAAVLVHFGVKLPKPDL